ncbi:MAG: hypothetical protein EKK46_06330 [Rhodocyclaceae bacterium]|nr:MAG: hypothetical protein EKK46_06330 [Rhodocyclaceae bacterium]
MTQENKILVGTRRKVSKPDESLAAVIAHQVAISDIEDVISNLDRIIVAKNNEIAASEAAIPKIDHLIIAREDLLAGAAAGLVTDGELKEFDSNSEAEREAHRVALAHSKVVSGDANQAIKGLQRKLRGAEEQLHLLHTKDHDLLRDLLIQLAESAGEKYVQATQDVKKHYLQILALENLSRVLHLKPTGFTKSSAEITLPSFNLASCKGVYQAANSPDVIFSDFLAHLTGATDEALQETMTALHESGVTLI